ncbi:MAG: hypothetical protein JNJ44_07755 [Zoogloeaceae bacterium]|nr:hypothetical protein [Zoogloeaceae bacterium]
MKLSALFIALAGAFTLNVQAGDMGPSTHTAPYLVASPGVELTSILTVGDSVKKKHKGNETYRMVGIPDGLGAYDNGDGTITVLMNHELRDTAGIVRSHGAKGAFVSKWQIRKSDLKVLNGEDLIQNVVLTSGTTTINRLCSADLAAPSAYFNSNTGKGFSEGRIFLSGEEAGATGRAFAHLASGRQHGTSYQLPALTTASWENLVASPFEQDKTIVAGLDDGNANASKVFLYVGTKQESGNPVEMAGLTNGTAYQVKIDGYPTEGSINGSVAIPNSIHASFSLVTDGSGSGLNRVEDGAWDTQNPNRFYFVTTDSFSGNTRLWRMTFLDIAQPELGGSIEILVNGAVTGQKMLDNMTVDAAGNVLMQEDPGNQSYLAKIWSYNPVSGALTQLAAFDPAQFVSGAPAFLTQDEESSGITEVSHLFTGVEGYDTEGYRYFLLDAQVHKSIAATDPELVEMGQLLMVKIAK